MKLRLLRKIIFSHCQYDKGDIVNLPVEVVEEEPALHQCPCDPACKCKMDESCLGCVTYVRWLNGIRFATENASLRKQLADKTAAHEDKRCCATCRFSSGNNKLGTLCERICNDSSYSGWKPVKRKAGKK